MKKILTILSIIISLSSFSQPVQPRSGASFTPLDINLFTQNSFRVPVFNDTTSANLVTTLDSCGKIIYTRDVAANWVRSCIGASSRIWIMQLPAGIPTINTAWLTGGNIVGTIDPDSAQLGTINYRNLYVITNDIKRFAIGRDGIAANTADVYNIGINSVTGLLSVGTTPTSTGWGILGNAGTNSATNFVGTTDAVDLVLRANSFEMMRLDQNYYNISIGYLGLPSTNAPTASVPNIAIGTQSMRNATTAYGNTAIGNESLNVLTTQQGNIAMGHQSGATATGIYGTYLGTHSGQNNTTGDYNVGIGYYSVFAAAGSNNTGAGTRTLQSSRTGNTALGFWALNGNGTGGAGTGAFLADYNVGIGYQAGLTIGANTYNVLVGALTASSDGLTNAGAIGAYASVTQANSISIGSINGTNGATSNANVGIGTTAPATRFHVAGTLRFVTGNQGANKVLASDGSGNADWVTPTTGTVTSVAQSFTGGLISVGGSPITSSGTLALTVAGTSGGGVYFSSTSTWASTGLLSANAIMIGGGAGTAYSTTTTGTNVLTALGVAVGSAGAFVVNGGALGTPSSGTVTNLTGTASININGTVGATTPAAGTFTSLAATGNFSMAGSAAIGTIGGGATAAEIRFLEPSASGANYSSFKAVAQSANIAYSLPPTVGAAGTQLTDVAGNGVLTWAAASSGGWATTGTTTLSSPTINLDGGDLTFQGGGNFNINGGNFTVNNTGTTQIGDINTTHFKVIGSSGSSKAFILSPAIAAGTNGDAITVVDVATGELGVAPNLAFRLMKDSADMYTVNGRIFVKDSDGNRTQISPHNKKGDWIYSSTDKNNVTTEINMTQVIKLLEKQTGKKLIKKTKKK